jgi:hypothetical protein
MHKAICRLLILFLIFPSLLSAQAGTGPDSLYHIEDSLLISTRAGLPIVATRIGSRQYFTPPITRENQIISSGSWLPTKAILA